MDTRVSFHTTRQRTGKHKILKVYELEYGLLFVKVKPADDDSADAITWKIDLRHLPAGYLPNAYKTVQSIETNRLGHYYALSIRGHYGTEPSPQSQVTSSRPYLFYVDFEAGESRTDPLVREGIVPDWIPSIAEVRKQQVEQLRWRVHELATLFDLYDNTRKWVMADVGLNNPLQALNASTTAHQKWIALFKRVSIDYPKLIGLLWRMLNRAEDPTETLVNLTSGFKGTGVTTFDKTLTEPSRLAFFFSVGTTVTGSSRIAVTGKNADGGTHAENVTFSDPFASLITKKAFIPTRIVVGTEVVSSGFRVEAVRDREQSYRVPSGFFHEGRIIEEGDDGHRKPPALPHIPFRYDNCEGFIEFFDALARFEYQSQRHEDSYDSVKKRARLHPPRTAAAYNGIHNFVRDMYALQKGDAAQTWIDLYNKRELRFTNHKDGGHHQYIHQALNDGDWDDLYIQYQNALDYHWEHTVESSE